MDNYYIFFSTINNKYFIKSTLLIIFHKIIGGVFYMKIIDYDRQKAKEYAKKWAYLRNPSYYNYDKLGGDCTNFVSQCILEGTKHMNYEKNGWYYKNANQKSPSWTGVEFLHQFLVSNKSVGPFGSIVEISKLQIGDIIQISFDGNIYGHSLFIIEKKRKYFR